MKTKHHRRAKSLGGRGNRENISRVKDNAHQAFHLLFGNGNPVQIAKELNEKWVDKRYRVVIVRNSERQTYHGEGIA